VQPLGYSPDGAAEALGVGVTHIYQLIGEGLLTAYKSGARTIVPRESLLRYRDRLPRADIRTMRPGRRPPPAAPAAAASDPSASPATVRQRDRRNQCKSEADDRTRPVGGDPCRVRAASTPQHRLP
jgi:excisionase family DNA binding protein